MWNWIELTAGILLLYFGAEWLVSGSAGLGRAFGVRPFVIGVTAVAYGTSMPELVVSTVAAAEGMSGLALGNVIGSNLANIGLILGLTALVLPIPVEGNLLRRELPVLLLSAGAIPVLLANGAISRWEGLVLLVLAGLFTWAMARSASPADERVETRIVEEAAPVKTGKLRLLLLGLLGLIVLVAGGDAFVGGASGIARTFGMSDRMVGLTIAAVGTSTPELAASIVAALRGHAAIAVGNVIGSNIFNVLFVLGGVAAIHPVQGSVAAFKPDLLALGVFTVTVALLLHKERVVTRWEGGVLLALYLSYMALLVAAPAGS